MDNAQTYYLFMEMEIRKLHIPAQTKRKLHDSETLCLLHLKLYHVLPATRHATTHLDRHIFPKDIDNATIHYLFMKLNLRTLHMPAPTKGSCMIMRRYLSYMTGCM